MIALHDLQLIYIHVPRTSGTAFTRALGTQVTNAQMDLDLGRHYTADQAIEQYPGYGTFTIMRSPWDIFRSFHGLNLMESRNSDHHYGRAPKHVYDMWMQQSVLPFSLGVQRAINLRMICRPGGFWRTYCNEDTAVFQYADQPYQQIKTWLGVDFTMHHEYGSVDSPPPWDQATIDLIGEFCHEDVDRFGYQPPNAEA